MVVSYPSEQGTQCEEAHLGYLVSVLNVLALVSIKPLADKLNLCHWIYNLTGRVHDFLLDCNQNSAFVCLMLSNFTIPKDRIIQFIVNTMVVP